MDFFSFLVTPTVSSALKCPETWSAAFPKLTNKRSQSLKNTQNDFIVKYNILMACERLLPTFKQTIEAQTRVLINKQAVSIHMNPVYN